MAASPLRFQWRLFVGGTVLFALLIGAVRLAAWRLEDSAATGGERYEKRSDALVTAGDYEERVRVILTILARADKSSPKSAVGAVNQAEQDLLALTVPTQYKDLHLNLVIALALMERGYNGEAASLSEGRQKLQTAIAPYGWLTSVIF